MEAEALCRITWEAWEKMESIKLRNVYNRWIKVLDLIIEDECGNIKVWLKRGRLYHASSKEVECLDDEETEAHKISEIEAEAMSNI